MCGIFGIYDSDHCLGENTGKDMGKGEILAHRGPDGYGTYFNPTVFLLHRRLSIIDLDGGSQPIYNEDKTKVIIFNGEIYNYRTLRSVLEKKGHVFTSNSDTEVVVHAYEQWGEDCLERFRGMFAFAIWDNSKKKLFIARDRLGIKPLFYAYVGRKLFFASEIKALLAQKEIQRDMDKDALASFFSFSYIPAPLTIFKHIRKLPAGHLLIAENTDLKIQKYWDVYFEPDYSKRESYFQDRFIELFHEAVELHLISDVPLGAFLSGGIDSGLVVAAMSRFCSEPVRTFTMGFGGGIGGYLDERGLAQRVSDHITTIHKEFVVKPDVKSIIENIVRSFDEPFADDTTIPSYYLNEMTRKDVTVSLSGLGGDELFGGYERYLGFKFSNMYNLLPTFIREKVVRHIVGLIPERVDGHYTINHLKRFVRSASLPHGERYFGFISTINHKNSNIFADPISLKQNFKNCRDIIVDLYHTDNANNPLDKIFYCDMKTYLPEDILACTDRLSMSHSLEVRVPFIDHKLVEFCATIPNEMKIKYGQKKYLLKKAALNYLPAEIFKHRKQGFASPMTQWIRSDLKDYVADSLSEANIKAQGIFNYKAIKTVLDQHSNRRETHDKLIWSLIIFQTWQNMYG